MAVEITHFSKRQVDKVGKVMRDAKPGAAEYETMLAQLNDWRELHMPIMNSYYHKCLEIAEKFNDPEIIVAARLKRTGYRGQHFIYEEGGMLVEVQLRTYFQHLWATTVETIDFFRGTAMKTRPDGKSPWQEFFELDSSIYALLENEPPLPQHQDLSVKQIVAKLRKISDSENIFEQILSYSNTKILDEDEMPEGTFYIILDTDVSDRHTTCLYYGEFEYSDAVDEYEKMEKENQGNIVLISVQDLEKVRSAYPNYFLNLRDFVKYTKLTIEKEFEW